MNVLGSQRPIYCVWGRPIACCMQLVENLLGIITLSDFSANSQWLSYTHCCLIIIRTSFVSTPFLMNSQMSLRLLMQGIVRSYIIKMEVCKICYNFDVENAFFQLENVKKITSVSSCCYFLEICASGRSGCATCQILSDGLALCDRKRWNSRKGESDPLPSQLMHILLDVNLPLRIEFGECGYDNQVEFSLNPVRVLPYTSTRSGPYCGQEYVHHGLVSAQRQKSLCNLLWK